MPGLVVESRLEDVDVGVSHPVDEAILLGDSPAPDVGPEVLQRFRFPQSGEGVTAGRLDQVQHLGCDPTVLTDPVPQVIKRLRLQLDAPALRRATTGTTSGLRHDYPFSPISAASASMVSNSMPPSLRERASACSRRRALCGERSR